MRQTAKQRIGSSLHRHRRLAMLGQKEAAERAGVCASYLCGVEKGVRGLSATMLGRLVSTFKISEKEATALLNVLVSEAKNKLTDDYKKGREIE